MSSARVSVVVPLHDGARTIGETLDSVAAQRAGDVEIEVIVVDDRSRDGGADIARAHPARPSVIASQGIGVSAARNTGFARATAPWVVFLDHDDVLLGGCIAERLAVARRHDAAGVVVAQHRLWWPRGARPARTAPGWRVTAEEARTQYLRRNVAVTHAHLVPRAALLDLTARDGTQGSGPFLEGLHRFEDWDVWLRLALSGVPFVLHDVADCLYRQREGMTMAHPDAPADALVVLERARALIESLPAPERTRLLRVWQQSAQDHRVWQATVRARRLDALGAAHAFGAAVLASPRDAPAIPLRLGLKLARRLRTRAAR